MPIISPSTSIRKPALKTGQIVRLQNGEFEVLKEQTGELSACAEVAFGKELKTGRKVAFKTPRTDRGDIHLYVDNVAREGRLLTRLKNKHPNIVQIIDLGTVTQDSLPVLVLEDLGDIEIGKVIKNEGPFRKNTTLRITETILEVDECLAENGVFHRDQKPSNIIYVPKRGPVLIDFGLSDCDEEGGSIYGRGRVIGTPLYMDDQTAEGYHEGEKSEVYSVAMNYLAMRIGENRLEPRLGPEWGAQFRRELRENIKTQLPKLEEDEREIIQRNLSERIRERQNFAEFRDSIRKIRSGVKQIETSQTLDSKTDNRWIITVATAAKALLAKIIEKL